MKSRDIPKICDNHLCNKTPTKLCAYHSAGNEITVYVQAFCDEHNKEAEEWFND